MTSTDHFVIVGKVVTAFGIKGWVKVFSFTDPVDNLIHLAPWYLDGKTVAVDECRPHGKFLIAKFASCDDRDKALLLSGKEISILRSQLPALPEEQYYWSDLTGLAVVNTQGITLGEVSYLFETGANDVLVLKNTVNKKEYYIPFLLDSVIKQVNYTEKTILVEWDEDF